MSNYVGRVFIDNNGNGTYEAGIDQPYPGLVVTVDDSADGGSVKTGLTDASGYYSIDSSGADQALVKVGVAIPDVYDPSPHGNGNPQYPAGVPTFPVDFPLVGPPIPPPPPPPSVAASNALTTSTDGGKLNDALKANIGVVQVGDLLNVRSPLFGLSKQGASKYEPSYDAAWALKRRR